MRVHDSQAYRKMDVSRERIGRILELREILLSIQIGFSLVNAAVACSILQSNSGLEPSSVITEPTYLKLVTVSSFCLLTLITIGTWNTRILRAAGKLQELTHEMDRYRWNILGLCEMRWENFGETTTEEGHTVFSGGKEDKHEHGVGFFVHKDIVNTVMGCRPVSSRLITVCLMAVPFNITIV